MATQPQEVEFWRQHWLAWRVSGLTQREYCTQQQLKFTQFVKWRRHSKQEQRRKRAQPVAFVPVSVRSSDPSSSNVMLAEAVAMSRREPVVSADPLTDERPGIDIALRNGHRIIVRGEVDATILRRLIGVLEAC